MTFDLAIIGAGPGGYVAALKAARLGAKVALIEKDNVGGVCLNRGCIPTKALIASAKAYKTAIDSSSKGVAVDGKVSFNLVTAVERKDKVVIGLRTGIERLLKTSGVEVIKGEASFISAGKINVNGSTVEAKNTIIATGSEWISLPNIKSDGKFIITSDEALKLSSVPKTLLVVGGGVIGCEFACMLSTLGTKVTIVEALESILPPVDRELSKLLVRSMKARGIDIFTSTTVVSAEVKGNSAKVALSNGETKEVELVLLSVGRRPCAKGLNLEAAGVAVTEKGFIKVSPKLETSAKGIYAIGDCKGGMMLAHVASAEGLQVVDYIIEGKNFDWNQNIVPSPIFTDPEIAAVGLTAEKLKDANVEFVTGRFPYIASGKAACDGETEGQAIVHADPKTGKIFGVHVIGNEATLLIPEAVLAMTKGLSARELENTIHSHPTLSEIVAEAAADVFGEAVHKAKRKS